MKLEEAIKRLNIIKNYICVDSDEDEENREGINDIEAIETVLQALDNSISKDKIKKVFDTKIYNTNYLAETDWIEHQREVDLRVADLLKAIKQELLEDK